MKDYIDFSIQNYQESEITLDGVTAIIYSLLFSCVFITLMGFAYYNIWGGLWQLFYFLNNWSILFIIFYIAGIVFVIEMIKGIYWSKFTDVKITVILSLTSISRFCHCDNVIKIKNYIFGLIMPIIILSIIPTLIGIIFGNDITFLLGLFNFLACSDLLYFIWLLRKINKNNFIKDINNKIGFITYGDKNNEHEDINN
jgi:hypothetical protein